MRIQPAGKTSVRTRVTQSFVYLGPPRGTIRVLWTDWEIRDWGEGRVKIRPLSSVTARKRKGDAQTGG